MADAVAASPGSEELRTRLIDTALRRGLRAFQVLDRVVVGSSGSGRVAIMDQVALASWWALTDSDGADTTEVVAELSAEYQDLTGALPDDADAAFERIAVTLSDLDLV